MMANPKPVSAHRVRQRTLFASVKTDSTADFRPHIPERREIFAGGER